MTITSEARAALLKSLKNGHDLLAACDKAGVELELVKSDPDLLAACELAFQTATSRLRSRLTEKCLVGGAGDITTLMRTIDGRADLQREQFKAPPAKSEDDGFDWSTVPDDDLFILSAALKGDIPEYLRLLAERDVGKRMEGRRELAAELAREKPPPLRPLAEIETLDVGQPTARSKAMITIPMARR